MSRLRYLFGAVSGFLIGFYGGEFSAPVPLFYRLFIKATFGLVFALVGVGVVWVVSGLHTRFKSPRLASIRQEQTAEKDQTTG